MKVQKRHPILVPYAQQACGVLVVDFAQNRFRQSYSVDAPTSLWRFCRGRVVEVLVFSFQEPVVDVIQLLSKDLLRGVETSRHGISTEHDSVLILLKELARRARL